MLFGREKGQSESLSPAESAGSTSNDHGFKFRERDASCRRISIGESPPAAPARDHATATVSALRWALGHPPNRRRPIVPLIRWIFQNARRRIQPDRIVTDAAHILGG